MRLSERSRKALAAALVVAGVALAVLTAILAVMARAEFWPAFGFLLLALAGAAYAGRRSDHLPR